MAMVLKAVTVARNWMVIFLTLKRITELAVILGSTRTFSMFISRYVCDV